ncbi:MAG: dihydroorotase [Bacteroidetes bacterium]|nr:MAG: dihydroorotase [Bacteroidota bacterium]
MSATIIRNARIVNEGQIIEGDVLIQNGRIEKIGANIHAVATEFDAQGHFLLPGIIDDQVHFREPGLTHKGTIASESRSAVAGGVTTYIEQPNTKPAATTRELLEDKFAIAARDSYANYSFNMGASNDNIEDLLRADYSTFSGIKVFMGSSTGNMLVDDLRVLERIFSELPHLIITHCEDEATIRENLAHYQARYGDDIPMIYHPEIRSEEACYLSSSSAVELAKRHNTRLHIYHISTGAETALFENTIPLSEKRITAEACIHHLWFSDEDYAEKGSFIKWNPAVKTALDREQIWKALLDGRIDVIATDHAPHTREEKIAPYTSAPSGGPLVQHAVQAMFDFVAQGKISIEQVVEKMCHNPAILFRIKDRGYIREGYHADLTLVDPASPYTVSSGNILSKCGWSPFEGHQFKSTIRATWVNGNLVWNGQKVHEQRSAQRLEFLTFG